MGDSSEMPMPTGVRYLVCHEFLSRFSVKGTQVVLELFLVEHFRLTEDLSTELVHTFLFILNVSPIFGAFLSDGYLGAYHTLLYFLFVQLAGMGILVLGAVPSAETGYRVIMVSASALGVLLLAVAAGGGKPTLPAFGGDQIDILIPKEIERCRLRALFFSLFYIAMNAGSFLASMVIPPLRSVGSSHSYGLIFFVQTAVLVVGLLVFWLGRRHYAHRTVSENIFVKVAKIIYDALRMRMKSQSAPESTTNSDEISNGEQRHLLSEGGGLVDSEGLRDVTCKAEVKKQHWLDVAKLKHEATSVEDVKLLLRVLTLFTAFPVFWALLQQMYTTWILQSRSMNLEVSWLGGLVLQPEQIQGLNPILVVVIIPILDQGVYPVFAKLNIPMPPLRKMIIGIGAGVVAFVASGFVQLVMDRSLASSTPTKISVFWQVPQYFFISLGEVLINTTGLDFVYSQAPSSMKSVLQAAWNLTTAMGNILTVVIIVLVGDRLSQANEFFLFAGVCAASMFLTMWISHGYEDTHSTVSAISANSADPIRGKTTLVSNMDE